MLRDFLTGLCLVVATSSAFAADNDLTGKNLIDGTQVTVGDIFTNTGRHASYVLAPTPKVGEKLTLSKADLERVASTFKLDWQPVNDDVTLTLERNALAVDTNTIVDALNASDLKQKVSDDASFQITSMKEPLIFQGQDPLDVTITETAFDVANEKFVATVNIARNGKTLQELNVKGIATPMATLPVLRHAVSSSTVIKAEDLTNISMPKRDVRATAFTSLADLIGMTPKRSLPAGQMINKNDVTPPILVKRNELITVFYRNGTVNLTTKARALDSGAIGDSVMLENTTSKKSFAAKITGPQQAEVLLDAING